MIPFGEFAPDQADYNTNVATVAENVISGLNSYLPIKALEDQSAAGFGLNQLAGACVSGYAFRNIDDIPSEFAATLTKIYRLKDENATALDITGTSFTLPATPRFASWGENLLIACGVNNSIQTYDVAAASTDNQSPTKTTDLAGSPPKARYIAVVGNFVVLGYVDDGTRHPERVVWSAFDDHEGWTAGTNQSDFQDIYFNRGEITGVVGGEYGLIFKRNLVVRMTYIGSPVIFQLEPIEENHGTTQPQSIVKVGDSVYYYSPDGFRVITDGINSVNISNNKITQYILEEIIPFSASLKGAYDSKTNSVFWTYSNGLNKQVIFNITNQKWTTATIDMNFAWGSEQPGVIGNDVFGHALTVYDSNNQRLVFSGTAMAATLETGESSDGINRTRLNTVRPVIDGTATVTVSTRDSAADTPTDTAATALDATGKANVRTNARYHRIKCTTSGDFTQAVGVEIEANRSGKR